MVLSLTFHSSLLSIRLLCLCFVCRGLWLGIGVRVTALGRGLNFLLFPSCTFVSPAFPHRILSLLLFPSPESRDRQRERERIMSRGMGMQQCYQSLCRRHQSPMSGDGYLADLAGVRLPCSKCELQTQVKADRQGKQKRRGTSMFRMTPSVN